MIDKRMTGERWRMVAVAVGLLVGGCARQTPPPPPPTPARLTPAAPADEPIALRSQTLSIEAQDFALLVKRLPAANDYESGQLFERVFAQLSQMLPVLGGTDAGGTFDHQVSVVQAARTQLAVPLRASKVNAIVQTGLGATYNALMEASQLGYYRSADAGEALKQLHQKLQELDQTNSVAQPLVEAEAVQQISRIIQSFAAALAVEVNTSTTAPAGTGIESPGTPTTTAEPISPPTTVPAPAAPEPTAPATTAPESPAPPVPAEPGTAPSPTNAAPTGAAPTDAAPTGAAPTDAAPTGAEAPPAAIPAPSAPPESAPANVAAPAPAESNK